MSGIYSIEIFSKTIKRIIKLIILFIVTSLFGYFLARWYILPSFKEISLDESLSLTHGVSMLLAYGTLSLGLYFFVRILQELKYKKLKSFEEQGLIEGLSFGLILAVLLGAIGGGIAGERIIGVIMGVMLGFIIGVIIGLINEFR